MTAPYMPQVDPRVEQLRAVGRQRGYSEEEIQAKLAQAGLVQPPTQGGGDEWGRGAGLAGRAVVQGLGALQNLNPFGAPARIGNQVAGIPQAPLGEADANQMGMPQPNTPGERMAVAGGEGATMGLIGGGAPIVGAAASLAGQGAQEMGASPLGQMAATAVVGMGFPVIKALLSGGIKAALAGAGSRRETAKQAMALLQAGDPNAPVTAGQVAQGGLLGGARTIEGGLKNIPGAGGVLKETWDQQAAGMGKRVNAMADQVSPGGSPATAGAAIQRGIEQGFIPRFKEASNQLYNRVFQIVKPDLPVMPAHTTALIAQQNELTSAARQLSDDITSPKFAGILNHLDQAVSSSPDGTIPLNVVKELRSRLGAMMSGDELVSDINMRDVNRLYESLSQDIRASLQSEGPEAVNAWDNASKFWKDGTDHIQRFLQPLMDKKTPEKAFTALMSGTKDGATMFKATMQSLAPEEQKMVAGTVLRRLGMASPGAQDDLGSVFSPETYLTNLNKLAPETKGALADVVGPKMSRDLDVLAKAANIRKTAGKALYNPSGTASNNVFATLLSSAGLFTAGAVRGNATMMAAGAVAPGGVGAANLIAKAFTNPRMVGWLVQQTRVPLGSIAASLTVLQKQAQKWDPESKSLAEQLNEMLSGVEWPKILMANAIAEHQTQ